MKKKVVFIFVLLALITTSVIADDSVLYKNDASFFIIPFAKQKINYTDNIPQVRDSDLGFGFKASYYRNLSSEIAIGVDTSIQAYRFEDFHNYCDFKINSNLRLKCFETDKERFAINLLMGIGNDFVVRDDSDIGDYILLNTALETRFRVKEQFDIKIGLLAAISFQNGSSVVHLNNYIGASYLFKDKKDEKH